MRTRRIQWPRPPLIVLGHRSVTAVSTEIAVTRARPAIKCGSVKETALRFIVPSILHSLLGNEWPILRTVAMVRMVQVLRIVSHVCCVSCYETSHLLLFHLSFKSCTGHGLSHFLDTSPFIVLSSPWGSVPPFPLHLSRRVCLPPNLPAISVLCIYYVSWSSVKEFEEHPTSLLFLAILWYMPVSTRVPTRHRAVATAVDWASSARTPALRAVSYQHHPTSPPRPGGAVAMARAHRGPKPRQAPASLSERQPAMHGGWCTWADQPVVF